MRACVKTTKKRAVKSCWLFSLPSRPQPKAGLGKRLWEYRQISYAGEFFFHLLLYCQRGLVYEAYSFLVCSLKVDSVTAHLARVERVNPAVNAIVTLVPEAAMDAARAADAALARGEELAEREALLQDHMRSAYERSQTSLPCSDRLLISVSARRSARKSDRRTTTASPWAIPNMTYMSWFRRTPVVRARW